MIKTEDELHIKLDEANVRIIELESALDSMLEYSCWSEMSQDSERGRVIKDNAIKTLKGDKKEDKFGIVLNNYSTKVEVRERETMQLLGFMDYISHIGNSDFVKLYKYQKVDKIDLNKSSSVEDAPELKKIHIDIREAPVKHYLISKKDWELLND